MRVEEKLAEMLHELAWWQAFACRFHPRDLPKVGEPLYGWRLKVVIVDDEDGTERAWSDR